jgi:hypothetical protein
METRHSWPRPTSFRGSRRAHAIDLDARAPASAHVDHSTRGLRQVRAFRISASLLGAWQILLVVGLAHGQDQAGDPPKDGGHLRGASPGSSHARSSDAAAARIETNAASSDAVDVHIDSPHPVALEKRHGPSGDWEFACTAPCDERQSVRAQYRIVGTELNESDPFTLNGSARRVVLKVTPGVHSQGEQGKWIFGGGGALTVAGVLVLALASNAEADSTGAVSQASSNAIFIGSAMIFAGLGGAILGGAWWVNNLTTGVGGDIGRTVDEKRAPGDAPGGVKEAVKFGASGGDALPSRALTFGAPRTSGLPTYVTIPVFGTAF